MVVVISTWARDKWKQGRQTESTKDTQRKMDAIMTFSIGTLVGVIGNSEAGFSQTSKSESHNAPAVISHEQIGPSEEIEIFVVEDLDTPESAPLP